MKLAGTITLPRDVKRMSFGTSFGSREDRNYFIKLMVDYEYQKARMLKQRGRQGAGNDSSSD